MIELTDLYKSFVVKDKKARAKRRIEAVRGISLTVQPGEIYGLLGPNGAGKSTTLRMIAGLMRPDHGRIEICGVDTQTRPEQARALLHDPRAVIFDEPTTGLDVLTAKTVLDLLRVMKAEGRSVVVSTHVMPMVEAICDRVGIIFDGVLHGDAPPREILARWGVATLDEVFFKLAAGEGGGA